MAKQILIGHGQRLEIMKALNVSYPTVRKSLRCQSDNEIANKIRVVALKKGGQVVEYETGLELKIEN
jgi:hypothetical protein